MIKIEIKSVSKFRMRLAEGLSITCIMWLPLLYLWEALQGDYYGMVAQGVLFVIGYSFAQDTRMKIKQEIDNQLLFAMTDKPKGRWD